SGRLSIPCWALWVGTKISGDAGKGRRPRRFLTAISHTETGLRNISLSGLVKSSRAFGDNSEASVVIQINEHVSSRSFTPLLAAEGLQEFCRQRLEKLTARFPFPL